MARWTEPPRKKRREPRVRREPSGRTLSDLEPIRGARVSPDLARIAGAPSSMASRKSEAQARQRKRAREQQRLRQQVARERAKIRQGGGLRADSGDVTRGTRVVPGERARAQRVALAEAAARSRARSTGDGGLRAILERELSGRGVIAEAFSDAARFVGEHALLVQTGPSTPLDIKRRVEGGSRMPAGIAAATAPSVVKVKEVPALRRTLEDLVNLPAVAVPSLYVPAAGLVEAAQGDTRRLRQLGRDIAESDPVYAAGEAAVKAVKGDRKGAKRAIKRAGTLASEHPGYTAIEVFGLKGTAGRGAGSAVRGTGRAMRETGRRTGSRPLEARGERVRRKAAVETREDAIVPGTAIRVRREYSRDLSNRTVQVAKDRRNVRKAQALRAEAQRLEGTDPDRAVALRKQANRKDPRIASDRDLKARENIRESRNENLRREAVGTIDQLVQDILRDAGDKGAAPVLIASGITRANVRDLAAYHRELTAAHAKLSDPAKRAANVRLRNAIKESVRAADKRGDPDMRQVLQAAQRYSKEVDQPLDRVLSEMGLLERERGERAKLIPLAARELGAKVDSDEGLVAGGRRLSTEEVRALARREREVDPVYVSQSPSARGPGAYYRASAQEPVIGSRARTERPTQEGTFDAAPEMLRARAMNAQGLVSAARNFRDSIADSGLRSKDGDVRTDLTRQEAEGLKRSLEQKHGMEFELVAVRPWAARREQLRELQDAIDSGGDLDPRSFAQFRDGLIEAFQGKGDGPFALVPRAVARQQVQHLRVLGPTDIGKVVRGARSAFTRTVLTTSPGPTFGNLVEPAVRSAMMRAGPVSAYRSRGTMRELRKLDPAAARRLEATIGRGKVTLAAQRRYVDPQQFDQGMVRQTVAGWQAVKRARGINRLTSAWDMWTHLVFDVVNGHTEAFFRQGPMLGKVLRDSGLMDDTLLGLSKHAMREAAKGLTDTPTQALLLRKLNDAYGKYQGFGPAGRKIIAEYTPFAAWWLSSITFIGKVLPRDHPGLTAAIAASAAASEEWRMAQGLDLFAGEAKLPGWLQGTAPAGKHGRAKLAYNTPFGAATDPGEAASSLVFPQGENLLKALQGLDWKNKKLRNDDGSEYDEIQKALYAAGEVLKSTVPAVAVPAKVKRYAEKPDTLLNPVRIPPRKGDSQNGAGAAVPADAESRALQREARMLHRERASRAEQDALRREARMLWREQQALAGR